MFEGQIADGRGNGNAPEERTPKLVSLLVRGFFKHFSERLALGAEIGLTLTLAISFMLCLTILCCLPFSFGFATESILLENLLTILFVVCTIRLSFGHSLL